MDFLCAEARLVIEIDGLIHESQQEYDAERDDFLREQGYRVLRVRAELIRRDLAAALVQIDEACQLPADRQRDSAGDAWAPPPAGDACAPGT